LLVNVKSKTDIKIDKVLLHQKFYRRNSKAHESVLSTILRPVKIYTLSPMFVCIYVRASTYIPLCLALRARKSRVKGWFRVACVSGQTMGRPQPGCAPGKHEPAAKLMSVPLMRFRRASVGQQIYDGARGQSF